MTGIRVLPLGLGYKTKLGAIYEYRQHDISEGYFSGTSTFVQDCDYPFKGTIKKIRLGTGTPYEEAGAPYLTADVLDYQQETATVSGSPKEAFVGIGEFDRKTHKDPLTPEEPEPIDPGEMPLEFFCDDSIDVDSVDTHEWDWTTGEIASMSQQHQVYLTGLFWEDRNGLLKYAESGFESDGELQDTSVVVLKDFHTLLYHLRQEVVAGRIDLSGVSYEDFQEWAGKTKALDCLSPLEFASVYYTGRLGIISLLHASATGFAIPAVATLVTEYLGRLPRKTVQWLDFNDVMKDSIDLDDPYTGAFFLRLGLETLSGYINMEPQALNHNVVFNAFNPHEYTNNNDEDPDKGFWGKWLPHNEVDWSGYTIEGFNEATTDQHKAMAAAETAIHEHGHSVDFFPLLSGGIPLSDSQEWLDIGGWSLDPDERTFLVKSVKSTETGGLPKTDAGHEAPVSDYGCSQPAEDFAEAYSAYIINPVYMSEKFPERFAFMDKNVKPLIEEGVSTKLVKEFLKYKRQHLVGQVESRSLVDTHNIKLQTGSVPLTPIEPILPEGTNFDIEFERADSKMNVTPNFIMYETRGRFPYVEHQIGTYSEYEFASKTGVKAASDHTGKITASPVLIGHHHENERGLLRNMFVSTKHAKNHRKKLVKNKTLNESETNYIYLDLLESTADPFEQSNRVIRGIIMKMERGLSIESGGTIVFRFMGRLGDSGIFKVIAEDLIFTPADTVTYTTEDVIVSKMDGTKRQYGLLSSSEQTQTVTLGEESENIKQGIFEYQQILGDYEVELFDVTSDASIEKFPVFGVTSFTFQPKQRLKSAHYGTNEDYRIWNLIDSPKEFTMLRSDFEYELQNFKGELQRKRLNYELLERSNITIEFIGYSSASPQGIPMQESEEYFLHGIIRELEESEKIFVIDGVIYQHYGETTKSVEAQAGVFEHTITFTYQAVECDFVVKCVNEANHDMVFRTITANEVPYLDVDEANLLSNPHRHESSYYEPVREDLEEIRLECANPMDKTEHIVEYKLITRDHEVELKDIVTGELLDLSEREETGEIELQHSKHTHHYVKAFPQQVVMHENLSYDLDPFGQTTSFNLWAESREPWIRDITYRKVVTNPTLILDVAARGCAYKDASTFVLLDSNDKVVMYYRVVGDINQPDVLNVPPQSVQEELGIIIEPVLGYEQSNNVYEHKIKSINISIDLNLNPSKHAEYRMFGYNSLNNPHPWCSIVNLHYLTSSEVVERNYYNINFGRVEALRGKDYIYGELAVMPEMSDYVNSQHAVELKPVATMDTSKTRTSEAIKLIKRNYRPEIDISLYPDAAADPDQQ